MTTEATEPGSGFLDLNIRGAGLTYSQFAERVGIDPSTVSRYRDGSMQPSYRVAEQMARALGGGITPWEILVDGLRMRWERDRGVAELDLFPRQGRAPIGEAVDALWRVANTINVSEWFREEIDAVVERLLDAVETECRLGND